MHMKKIAIVAINWVCSRDSIGTTLIYVGLLVFHKQAVDTRHITHLPNKHAHFIRLSIGQLIIESAASLKVGIHPLFAVGRIGDLQQLLLCEWLAICRVNALSVCRVQDVLFGEV